MKSIRVDFSNFCDETLNEMTSEARRQIWKNEPNRVFTIDNKEYQNQTLKKNVPNKRKAVDDDSITSNNSKNLKASNSCIAIEKNSSSETQNTQNITNESAIQNNYPFQSNTQLMDFNPSSQVPSTQIPYCSFPQIPVQNVLTEQNQNQHSFSYPYYQNNPNPCFNFNNYSKSSYSISYAKNNENNSNKECQSSLADDDDDKNTGFAPV